jgi:hypothetical protein
VSLKAITTRYAAAGGRSSQRLSVAIPVRVTGKDIKGKSFTEETRTTEVNRTGSRLCLSRELESESQVQVTLVSSNRSSAARVVWVRPAENTGYWDAGLELKESGGDFWGIQFPGDEWKPKAERIEEPAVQIAEPAILREPLPPVPELDPVIVPPPQTLRTPNVAQADLTDLLNAALTDALQENIRTGMAVLAQEAERKIAEVKQEALEAAEQHLRSTIASCGEDLEMRAIDVVARNERALEQAATEVAKNSHEQIEERVREASTVAAEAIQQMLDMANIGCTRLKQDTDQAVSSAASAVRQKLNHETPQIEDQLIEQCQVRTARLLNSRLEEAEANISTRLAELSRQLSSRTEEMVARFELALDQRYTRTLAEHSEQLQKQLTKAAERIHEDFERRMARDLDRRQEELLKDLEARTNAVFTQNLNRSRRVLARNVRDLGEALQQEADGFGLSPQEPA